MAKTITYDPAVIQEFASRLYGKANSIIATYLVVGLILGSIAGGATGNGVVIILGALVGAALGFLMGKERAFKLKLEAQVALCQVQIENNTAK